MYIQAQANTVVYASRGNFGFWGSCLGQSFREFLCGRLTGTVGTGTISPIILVVVVFFTITRYVLERCRTLQTGHLPQATLPVLLKTTAFATVRHVERP